MKSIKCGSGTIYSIPMKEIDYVGYFYGNSGKETVKQARSRLSAKRGRAPDFLFNAELFDFKTRKAVSDVVCGGKVHKLSENYGIAFPCNNSAIFCYKNNVKAGDYVGAYPVLIKNNAIVDSNPPAGLSGSRGRTAIGVGHGNFIIALIPDGSGDVTLGTLKYNMHMSGATDAINLDGGGSTQYYAPEGNFFSSRPVRGFIGVWLKKISSTTTKDVRFVKVNTNLRIRNNPNLFGKVVGRLYNGDKVEVLEAKNGWCRISSGWVSEKYLRK